MRISRRSRSSGRIRRAESHASRTAMPTALHAPSHGVDARREARAHDRLRRKHHRTSCRTEHIAQAARLRLAHRFRSRGGNYDGQVGSMGAIEVAQTLAEQGVMTRHPIEVVIWQNEEGGLYGSRAVSGQLTDRRAQERVEQRQDDRGRDRVHRRRRREARSGEAPQRATSPATSSCTSSRAARSSRRQDRHRRRRRHRRHQAVGRDRHGLREPRRHDADGPAA